MPNRKYVELPTPETVIWGLDGTLLNSFEIYGQIVKQVTTEWNLPDPDFETVRHNFHQQLEPSLGTITGLTGEPLQKFLDHFLEVQETYYEHPEEHIFADSLRLAQAAHEAGARQVIVTNRENKLHGKNRASPGYFVKHTLLNGIIDTIISSDTTQHKKPDKEVVAGVLPANYNPETVAVFGDQHIDAQLARNLGAVAVIVNRHVDPVPHLHTVERRASALHVVESFDEVRLV